MQDNDAAVLKALKTKLNNFIKIVLAEAEVNHNFRKNLEELLLESSAGKPASKAAKTAPKATRARKTKEKFNPVGFLQENGEERLVEELSLKTGTELKSILRTEGIKKPKGVKTFERQQMIDEIVKDAVRRLHHGIIASGR